MDNSDENSNILYSKIKYKENKNNKDNIITTNASDNQKYNSNIIKLFEKRKNEKFFILVFNLNCFKYFMK